MTRTILLADDSVTIQKVVELTFLDEDFHVVSYGNGSDAIDHLPEMRPDVVLADVHMPGADGYEVCVATKQLFPAVPVLLLVGTFEIFDAGKASDSGAQGHLKKPFDSQELLRRVKDLLESAAAPTPPAVGPEGANWSMATAEPLEEPMAPHAAGATGVVENDWSFEPVGEEGFELGGDIGETSEPPAMATLPELETSAEYSLPESEQAAAVEPQMAPTSDVSAKPVTREAEGSLSDDDVDRIARRVVELLGERVVRDIAWDVVPDLAELLVKERIRELEASVE